LRKILLVGQAKSPQQEFAGNTPAGTITNDCGAVSSVVEHLVYTERVGGSKPSPPNF
jgi:hypothetical protein